MNKPKLKTYAPVARREFIQAMTDRAGYYGLTATHTEPVSEKGDVAVIGGRSFPLAVATKRKQLENRIKRHGFQQTMESLAYTWFNRLVAIRFMELHGYLEHGYRVLSSPRNDTESTEENQSSNSSVRVPSVSIRGSSSPEILLHAEHLDLPQQLKEQVIQLKLAGNQEAQLYRLLLLWQCNALHSAMPFLFEKIDDETELLLPDNLLNSDSLIRKLVGEIDEEDWNEVEIIGWLYQFYISEKKDEVIGKVVASEDIPAATQLFTPNWIVKYLVQNTLGRQWLATYPQSALRQQMEYYIEPAEQTPEVQEQLKAITPSSLNPEELSLLDPACGSGHILVEAYDLFKAIYQERGYRARDIPALILQKNLFGMEIDDRAAQLAAFALMMKARADDRRIFDREAKPNIVAFVDSQGMDASEIYFALTSPLRGEQEGELESSAPDGHLFESDDNLFTRAEAAPFSAHRPPTTAHFTEAEIASLLELFENAKTFGSLIQLPPKLAAKLPEIENRLDSVLKFGDLTHASTHILKPLLQQARRLSRKYHAVVANPPYMGTRYMTANVKSYVKDNYDGFHQDLFSGFIKRSWGLIASDGQLGFVVPFNWMFLSSHEELRQFLLSESIITSEVQLEFNAFEPAMVSVCLATFQASRLLDYAGAYIRLSDFRGSENQSPKTLEAIRNRSCGWFYSANQADFEAIPGRPIAYWAGKALRQCFRDSTPIGTIAEPRLGMATGNNARYVRCWWEVDVDRIGFGCPDRPAAQQTGRKWFPYNKGGDARRWYGNNTFVVNWMSDGHELQTTLHSSGRVWAHNFNLDYIFRPCVTWTFISSSFFAVRSSDAGFLFDVAGSSAFPSDEWRLATTGFLASKPAFEMMKTLNPTMNFQAGNVATLPLLQCRVEAVKPQVEDVASNAIDIARIDWDCSETSWDFECLAIIQYDSHQISSCQNAAELECLARFNRMKQLEVENNRLFIEAYGLQEELSPEVADEQITLYRPDCEEDIKRLLSYAIGCIMGRYSLDRPGLIYAHSGNEGFDPSQYTTFRADEDGIIPLLETDWGIRDDATNRFVEFVNVCWPGDPTTDHTDSTDQETSTPPSRSVSSVKSVVQTSPYLEENLKFVADSLGPTGSEQPRDTIRRYLATGFYKHHLSMYKKRPIYWLFSSGKQRAFQCLVYLHRYHEGTLARMRTEYVIPLQGQIAARIEQLEGDKAKATSTSHRKKLQKEQDDLKKQQKELFTFEEKLKHYADQRITLDLDDGVKVNYAKFGDLLAEAKAITGGKDEE
jgi:type II restriction/modification system DNA methylase subunit YeeA